MRLRHGPWTVFLACNLFVGVRLHPSPLNTQNGRSDFEEQIQTKIAANQLDAALDLARRAVGQYPESSQMRELLGVVLFKKGANEEARIEFRRAIELDPSVPENYFNLALVDLSEKRYAQAAASLEKHLGLDPHNAYAHLLLGRAYHNLDLTAPAIEQFRKAIAIAPQLPLAHYHLGYAYQSQGNLNAALEEFKMEIQYNPTFYDSYWLAGNVELRRENLDAAAGLFVQGIQLKPQAWQARYGLGRVLAKRKQWSSAENELKKALEAVPDNVEVHYALARLYQETGRKEDAHREFDVCNRLNLLHHRAGSGIAGQQP